jgi:hypothetical protein
MAVMAILQGGCSDAYNVIAPTAVDARDRAAAHPGRMRGNGSLVRLAART